MNGFLSIVLHVAPHFIIQIILAALYPFFSRTVIQCKRISLNVSTRFCMSLQHNNKLLIISNGHRMRLIMIYDVIMIYDGDNEDGFIRKNQIR